MCKHTVVCFPLLRPGRAFGNRIEAASFPILGRTSAENIVLATFYFKGGMNFPQRYMPVEVWQLKPPLLVGVQFVDCCDCINSCILA